MLERQIVKALGKQIDDTENSLLTKYVIKGLISITWIIISINVTIYRTIALPETYENSYYIITTKRRRSMCFL
jgi:hypothetical protein